MPDTIEIVAIQLPGRELRFREAPLTDMREIVSALVTALIPRLSLPYVTFGHSLGAILSYEVVKELLRCERRAPEHMIISGRGAPHISDDDEPRYLMRDPQLIQALRKLEGTPPDLLENRELMELFLPTLRADFEVAETYTCPEKTKMPCNVSVYGGLDDTKVTPAHLNAWGEYTQNPVTLQMFPGGHFFIHSAQQSLLQALLRDIPK